MQMDSYDFGRIVKNRDRHYFSEKSWQIFGELCHTVY